MNIERLHLKNRIHTSLLQKGTLLLLVISFIGALSVEAQTKLQTPKWDLLQEAGKLVRANASLRTIDGWTHFYNEESNILLLSVKLGEQEIGSIKGQLRISSGLLANYGKAANDLSGASYVDQSIWLTMNRYWRIENATPLNIPVRVRYYYSKKDYDDLTAGLSEIGLEDKQRGELLFFALTGKRVHPFSSRPEAMQAEYVPLRDTLKAETVPWRTDIYYAEFELENLDAGGSGGFLIPFSAEAKSISGRVLRPDGSPVEGALFPSSISGASVRSDELGYYSLANIEPGKDFVVSPTFGGSPTEHLSVLDLIALESRLEDGTYFEEPWRELAADVDRSGKVDEADLIFLKQLILGQGGIDRADAIQFIPSNMEWPEGQNPLRVELIESITINNLISDQENIDFIAIKRGDIWQESSFPNDPPVLLDAGFALSEEESCGGNAEILIDLEVSGFDDVMGFQFSIEWDPSILYFLGGQNFNLPGFDEDDLYLQPNDRNQLSISWHTLKASKKTRLPDGTVVCQLRFRGIGPDNSASDIKFIEDPTPIQVLRKNRSTSNVLFTSGKATIKWDTGVDTYSTDIKSTNCFSTDDGVIDLTISGTKGPFQFLWNTGAQTEDIQNLIPGNYSVTITSQSKCPLVLDSLKIEEPRVLFIHNENVRQIQCPEGTDGAINFKTSGGTPPYSYHWSNDFATPWVGNLGEGKYAVTVSDVNGCEASQYFEILPPKPLYINYGISPTSKPNKSDGAISISNLIGSTPPQQYTWSDGTIGPNIENLAPGKYEVTVSDAAYCSYQLNFEITHKSAPELLDGDLVSTDLAAGSNQLLTIVSPKDQTVQVRFFDARSQMIWQKIVPLQRGDNFMYFTAPENPGSYLIQIQPPRGAVCSIRFRAQ